MGTPESESLLEIQPVQRDKVLFADLYSLSDNPFASLVEQLGNQFGLQTILCNPPVANLLEQINKLGPNRIRLVVLPGKDLLHVASAVQLLGKLGIEAVILTGNSALVNKQLAGSIPIIDTGEGGVVAKFREIFNPAV